MVDISAIIQGQVDITAEFFYKEKSHPLLCREKRGMTTRTMTTNLNRDFTAWATAACNTESDRYIMVTRAKNDWYLLSNHEAELILSLEILVDEGDGICPAYSYNIDDPYNEDDGVMFTMIVRDRSSMIVRDDGDFYAFGVTDEPAPLNCMLIYARTEKRCMAILATCQDVRVHTFDVD